MPRDDVTLSRELVLAVEERPSRAVEEPSFTAVEERPFRAALLDTHSYGLQPLWHWCRLAAGF
jgi:hypothetical protein